MHIFFRKITKIKTKPDLLLNFLVLFHIICLLQTKVTKVIIDMIMITSRISKDCSETKQYMEDSC